MVGGLVHKDQVVQKIVAYLLLMPPTGPRCARVQICLLTFGSLDLLTTMWQCPSSKSFCFLSAFGLILLCSLLRIFTLSSRETIAEFCSTLLPLNVLDRLQDQLDQIRSLDPFPEKSNPPCIEPVIVLNRRGFR